MDLLYATLFPGAVGVLLSQALEAALPTRSLRLVISLERAPDYFAAMPWEFLYRTADEATLGAFLGTMGTAMVSRAIGVADTLPAPRIVEGAPRIVLVTYGSLRDAGSAAVLDRLFADRWVELIRLRDPAAGRPSSTSSIQAGRRSCTS